jgi:hypothetical protein
MAHSTLLMLHPVTGESLSAPVGWSWTSLFFGFVVPAFRQDWWMAIITMLLTVVFMAVVNVVMAVAYNRGYITRMLRQGFVITGYHSDLSRTELEHLLGVRIQPQQLNG